jgi:hypothetical protein
MTENTDSADSIELQTRLVKLFKEYKVSIVYTSVLALIIGRMVDEGTSKSEMFEYFEDFYNIIKEERKHDMAE